MLTATTLFDLLTNAVALGLSIKLNENVLSRRLVDRCNYFSYQSKLGVSFSQRCVREVTTFHVGFLVRVSRA